MQSLLLKFAKHDISRVNRYLVGNYEVLGKDELKGLSIIRIIGALRKRRYDKAIVYCDNIESDGKIILYEFMLALCKVDQRLIVEPNGNAKQFSLLNFYFCRVPSCFLKFLSSLSIVLITYLVFYTLKIKKE